MHKSNDTTGTLFVVATPIGHLGDLSERMLNTLVEVDLIAAEDTRVTRTLLQAYAIETPTTSFHQHTSGSKQKDLLKRLQNGESIALVTDAGTPGVSDPGSEFVAMVADADINVTPVPGPSAVTTAISISGFPTHRFTFVGFPPSKKGRASFFEDVNAIEHTVVLYESKHRLQKTLDALDQDRRIMIGRELTKKFETIYRGTVSSVQPQVKNTKGEFVLVLAPKQT